MSRMDRLAFVSSAPVSGERGGAEIFNERMVEHLQKYVRVVEHIPVPCSEATFDDILRGYLNCYDLDLGRFDGVITAKAPTFAVRHPNHVCYLQHTVRVFYDMFDEIRDDPANEDRRKLIHRMDTELLSWPHTKKLFSIGHEVDRRLRLYNGLGSTVMHHGLPAGEFYCVEYDYVYMPGRLHKWKRVDLMVRAMRYVKSPVRLKIAGTGPEQEALRRLAGDDGRIEFLGFVSDKAMKELYANALAVIFTPVREDYGLILHEGFKSKKPVITCTDSGEPVHFIRQGENGFAVQPEPREIAECVDFLYENKDRAAVMGQCGYDSIAHISWDSVVKALLNALEE